jgi:hypothetical protein
MNYLSEIDCTSSINHILVDFDFLKVQVVMRQLDWHWITEDGKSYKIPDIPEMKRVSSDLLRQVYLHCVNNQNSDEASISTGGFKASAAMDLQTKQIYLSLEFVLEQSDNEV